MSGDQSTVVTTKEAFYSATALLAVSDVPKAAGLAICAVVGDCGSNTLEQCVSQTNYPLEVSCTTQAWPSPNAAGIAQPTFLFAIVAVVLALVMGM